MWIALCLRFIAAMAILVLVAAMAMRITFGSLSLLAFLLAALGAQDSLLFVRLASETRITGNLVVLAIILAGILDAWCRRPSESSCHVFLIGFLSFPTDHPVEPLP